MAAESRPAEGEGGAEGREGARRQSSQEDIPAAANGLPILQVAPDEQLELAEKLLPQDEPARPECSEIAADAGAEEAPAPAPAPACRAEGPASPAAEEERPAGVSEGQGPEAAEAASLAAAALEVLARDAGTDAEAAGGSAEVAGHSEAPASEAAAVLPAELPAEAPAAEAPSPPEGGQRALPPIAEDAPTDVFALSFDHIGFKSDLLKEALGRRSNHSMVAAAARSRHARRPTSTEEDDPGPGLTQWSLSVTRQVERLCTRLDGLERELVPVLQRTALEAQSMSKMQERKMTDWTDRAAKAIMWLDEEMTARKGEVRELQLALARAANLGALGSQRPGRGRSPPAAEGGRNRSPPPPAAAPPDLFTPAQVEHFAATCQRAAAEATAVVTQRFEQQAAEQTARMAKEFETQRQEVLRLMEALSAKAEASLTEAVEELASQGQTYEVAAEGRAMLLKRSLEASPGGCTSRFAACEDSTSCGGDSTPRSDTVCKEAETLHPTSQKQHAGGEPWEDMAVVEQSDSLKLFFKEDVLRVRKELQEAAGPRRQEAASPGQQFRSTSAKSLLWPERKQELEAEQGWSFWSKALACSAPEAASNGGSVTKDLPVVMNRGLWEELVGGPGCTEVPTPSDRRPEEDGLYWHTAL